jgi:HPt (histidine-containing phosphotransfer) domain-containing protein
MNQVITKPVAWPDLFGAMKNLTHDHEAESRHAQLSVSRVHLPASSDVPLLDRSVLAEAEKWLGGDTLRRLMLEAAAEAERAHVEVAGHVGDPDEIRRILHRLRSVNGNFGLARIAAVAEQIEAELNEGGDVGLLVAALAEVTKATRHAIEGATLLS